MTLDDRYLRLPFDEAVDYLRQRISLPSDRFDDFDESFRDAIFTVAGAKGALLNDIRAAVESSIAEGKRIEDFRDEFDSIVERRGWSPRGGKDWRARLIYSQNLATSYAAGRYTYQLDPGVLEVQPYLQYIHGDSRAPRPAHLALDGKIFRANELPFYPPAGFGCSCRTISLTQRDVQGKEISDIKQGDTIAYKDDREVTREAVIQPDKGFNFRPEMPSDQRRQDSIANILARSTPAIRREIEKELARVGVGSPTPEPKPDPKPEPKRKAEEETKISVLEQVKQLKQEAAGKLAKAQSEFDIATKAFQKKDTKESRANLYQVAADLAELRTAASREEKAAIVDLINGNKSKTTSPIKEHGMPSAEQMWKLPLADGLAMHGVGDVDVSHPAVKSLQSISGYLDLPEQFTQYTKDIYLSTQRNKDDSYWAVEYDDPEFTSRATGGDGGVVVYNGYVIELGTLIHEGGHNFATARYGKSTPISSSDYALAVKQEGDHKLSEYANAAIAEDFAETTRIYFSDPTKLKEAHPKRYQVIKKLLEDKDYGG